METVVAINLNNGSVQKFEKFNDALDYINQNLNSWNAFDTSKPIQITVDRQESATNTLKVEVSDEMKTGESLG